MLLIIEMYLIYQRLLNPLFRLVMLGYFYILSQFLKLLVSFLLMALNSLFFIQLFRDSYFLGTNLMLFWSHITLLSYLLPWFSLLSSPPTLMGVVFRDLVTITLSWGFFVEDFFWQWGSSTFSDFDVINNKLSSA